MVGKLSSAGDGYFGAPCVGGGRVSATSNSPSAAAKGGNLSLSCGGEGEIPQNAGLRRDVYTAAAAYENEL